MSTIPPDVLIVGAGPVGLITALGLAREGLAVTVIDRDVQIGTAPRAISHLYPVLDGFERLGILTDVEAHGLRGEGLQYVVLSTGERIFVSTRCLDGVVAHPYVVNLGQDGLTRVVLEHLERMPNATVRFGARAVALTQRADGVSLTIATPGGDEVLEAGWLVGADGADSFVRQTLGLGFEGVTWPDRFVATNIRHPPLDEHGFGPANMVIDSRLGAVVAKFTPDGLFRCTFSESEQLPLDGIEDRIRAYYREALPGPGDPELVAWSPYRMHQRSAERYRVARVLLAGDAAHITNPTGGLGLTCGLLDAFVLTQALAAVIRRQVGDEVMDRYSDARRRVFLELASPAASEFKRLVYHSDDPNRLEQELMGLRAVAADPAKAREQMLFLGKLATPPLVAAA